MALSWIKMKAADRRDARRRDAERRQAAHEAMTGFDKLAKLAERPGRSERERARILAAA